MANEDKNGGVWVYGKVEPGWYLARISWSDQYAASLREKGYVVQQSVFAPQEIPEVA